MVRVPAAPTAKPFTARSNAWLDGMLRLILNPTDVVLCSRVANSQFELFGVSRDAFHFHSGV